MRVLIDRIGYILDFLVIENDIIVLLATCPDAVTILRPRDCIDEG
jgi:hypothetical protein